MDDAFTNFLRNTDPRKVEMERFGWPHDSERPGSPQDRRMRREHELHKLELARKSDERDAEFRQMQLAMVATELDRRFKGTPEQEQAIAAYAARKHERKAS